MLYLKRNKIGYLSISKINLIYCFTIAHLKKNNAIEAQSGESNFESIPHHFQQFFVTECEHIQYIGLSKRKSNLNTIKKL